MSEAQYSCENWWFDETDAQDEQSDDEQIDSIPGNWQRRKRAHRIARFAVTAHPEPVARDSYLEDGTEVLLSDEGMLLPYRHEDGDRTREVYQEPSGRRYNPETGQVAGEGTAAYIPEFSKDVFEAAIHGVLARTGHLESRREQWLTFAGELWHGPQYNSLGSLLQFTEIKLKYDDGLRSLPF
jgi:hypothetical protein